jgi:hypothetical protein
MRLWDDVAINYFLLEAVAIRYHRYKEISDTVYINEIINPEI